MLKFVFPLLMMACAALRAEHVFHVQALAEQGVRGVIGNAFLEKIQDGPTPANACPVAPHMPGAQSVAGSGGGLPPEDPDDHQHQVRER